MVEVVELTERKGEAGMLAWGVGVKKKTSRKIDNYSVLLGKRPSRKIIVGKAVVVHSVISATPQSLIMCSQLSQDFLYSIISSGKKDSQVINSRSRSR